MAVLIQERAGVPRKTWPRFEPVGSCSGRMFQMLSPLRVRVNVSSLSQLLDHLSRSTKIGEAAAILKDKTTVSALNVV